MLTINTPLPVSKTARGSVNHLNSISVMTSIYCFNLLFFTNYYTAKVIYFKENNSKSICIKSRFFDKFSMIIL